MPGFNKVFLMGHLTRDIELRYTGSGTAVGSFGLEVNRTWTGKDGKKGEETTFVDMTAWGKQAETMGQYLHKGSAVFVEGRLKLDQWDDKATGAKRSKLTVTVENFQFIGGKDDAPQTGRVAQGDAYKPPPDDDIPF